MKVILSRKGFDSGYGGYPSLILPSRRMITLPIPDEREIYTYSGIQAEGGKSVMDYMAQISPKIRLGKKQIELSDSTRCHLDPDIYPNTLAKRIPSWRGVFGQRGAAQSVLENNGVTVGDLFLFFGWFSHFPRPGQKFSRHAYCNSGFHALFGYLQIGEIYHACGGEKVPEWLAYHPHVSGPRSESKSNCIYIAREHVSWNRSIPGFGGFLFDESLKLSAEGLSRSKWKLPEFFKGLEITYHTPNSWKDGYFQSACIGQEFVVEENRQVSKWAMEIVNTHQS